MGRLQSVVYSATNRIDYIYDPAGNLIEERINGAEGLGLSVAAGPVAGGSVQIQPLKSSYVAGDVVSVTASPSAGYVFTGWSGLAACGSSAACTFTMPSGNVALVANFQPPSGLFALRTLAAPAAGGTVTAPNPAGYGAGTTVSLTATPAAGYAVDYWYGAACTNYSGTTCTFAMPAQTSDVYVRFKQVGTSGYPISTQAGFADGVPGNPLAAGMLEVSPGANNIPAGTPVTFKVHTATGYRFMSLRIQSANGTDRYDLCTSILNFIHLPYDPPQTCTFTMPAEALNVIVYFEPFPEHFALDMAIAPAKSGEIKITMVDAPNSFEEYLDWSKTPPVRMVQGGLLTTLTAAPYGARKFVNWANGPCAGSTNPVCSFTMPKAKTIANAVFSDVPSLGCTYDVVRTGSGLFGAAGGSMTLNVQTQAGCNFNAALDKSYYGTETLTTSGSTVTLNVPPKAVTFATGGSVALFVGRELQVIPYVQLGSTGSTLVDLPDLSFNGITGLTGDLPPTTATLTVTNNSGQTQTLRKPQTIGPFALRSTTCAGSLAAGASCTFDVQYLPLKVGSDEGEFQLAGNTVGWRAKLLGYAILSRRNVAAASAGGSVSTSEAYDATDSGEYSLINGERRGDPGTSQGAWTTSGPLQTIELKFASKQTVDRVDVITRDLGFGPFSGVDTPQGEPSPDVVTPAVSVVLNNFSVEYWTGTGWSSVGVLSRIDAPKRWLQVGFTAVNSDRLRLTLIGINNRIRLTEVEAWTTSRDATPDPITFTTLIDVEPNRSTKSETVTPTGFNVPIQIFASNGFFSIGCTPSSVQGPETLNPGESFCVRHTSAAAGGSMTTTLNIGGQTATFTSRSAKAVVQATDAVPDAVAAQSISGVQLNAMVNFAPITVSGINVPVALTIAQGEFSLGCTGAYQTAATTVQAGTAVCVRHVAGLKNGVTVASVLGIGSLNVGFSSTTVSSGSGDVAITPPVAVGWNLLGNPLNRAISAATSLNDAAMVESAWKWDEAALRWDFYTPQLSTSELQTYASSKGFGVLAQVLPGEGYWVKAKVAGTLPTQTGQMFAVDIAQLVSGWNLVAAGNTVSPDLLSPSVAGGNVVSMWAWDTEQNKWYLYAPSLDKRGLLVPYVNGSGYLVFRQGGSTLMPGKGFWINRK